MSLTKEMMPRVCSFQPGLRLIIDQSADDFFFRHESMSGLLFQEPRVVFVFSVFDIIWNPIPSVCCGLPFEAAGFVGSFESTLPGRLNQSSPQLRSWFRCLTENDIAASQDVWRSCFTVSRIRSGEFFKDRRGTDGLLLISQLALAESYELAFMFPWSVVRDVIVHPIASMFWKRVPFGVAGIGSSAKQ